MRVSLALLVLVALVWLTVPALADEPPSATPAQLASLREILARPEFQAGEGRSLLDRLLDPVRAWVRWLMGQVLEFLVRLLGPVADASGSVIVLGTVAVGLVIVVGAAILLQRLTRGAVSDDAALAEASSVRRVRAADELARARALAQAGQPRQAIHHQYRAVLLRLDERDHLALDHALTNRELLPRLTGAPELAGLFSELVARFDRLWYGQTDCSSDEYAAFARLADRIWQGAGAA